MPRRSQASDNEHRVLKCAAFRNDGWLPFPGGLAAARRLQRQGLLAECGVSAMPPHVLFVVTDQGRMALGKLQHPVSET